MLCVVINEFSFTTELYNFAVNSEELIGTTEYVTL
jgi:hypothetical protein